MEYKELYKGVKVPIIGLGTWQIGGRKDADHTNDARNITAIKKAINFGYTMIDTAEMYGAGHTEELVGEAMLGYDRSKFFVISKVMAKNLSYNDLIRSINGSLSRLKTNYLDLYLIHGPNPYIPIEETMHAMDTIVENKLTRFIGVSNFSVTEIEEAQKYARNKIVANQVQYSLGVRNRSTYGPYTNMEAEIIPYCQEHNILIIADRPLQKGVLLRDTNSILDRMAEKYHKTKAQIAINWLVSKEGIVTIPMSTSEEHLRENLGAIGWKLEDADMKQLDNANFGAADT